MPGVKRPPPTARQKGWGCGILLAAVVGVSVCTAIVNHGARGRSGSDAQWQIMATDTMHGHLGALSNNQRAGNVQGVLNERTKLAGDCREAGTYEPGATSYEQNVRQACAALGLPLG